MDSGKIPPNANLANAREQMQSMIGAADEKVKAPPSPDNPILPDENTPADWVPNLTNDQRKELNDLIPGVMEDLNNLHEVDENAASQGEDVDPTRAFQLGDLFALLAESLNLKQTGVLNTAEIMNANTATSQKLSDRQIRQSYVPLDLEKANAGTEQQQEHYRTFISNVNTRLQDTKDAISRMIQTNQQRGKGFMTQASSETSGVTQDSEILSSMIDKMAKIVDVILKGR
jgi:hypothetical protein